MTKKLDTVLGQFYYCDQRDVNTSNLLEMVFVKQKEEWHWGRTNNNKTLLLYKQNDIHPEESSEMIPV